MRKVTITMIAAMAKGNVIGQDNTLPWSQPADLAHFKRLTLGKPVIMGRKTFESIGRPLPKRENIVVTRSGTFSHAGVTVVKSIDEAMSVASHHPEVIVIGGDSIYSQCLNLASVLYITHIDAEIAGDARFPDFLSTGEWLAVECEQRAADEKNQYSMEFVRYERQ